MQIKDKDSLHKLLNKFKIGKDLCIEERKI